ncbi:hypothetical protein EVAR_4418_1 [Eumeta japonica]|uniref:Uncharacterized protein n=1 Tax=Eumeta variegata TaxID=151549 RepID=A0A4C1SYI2_EUMVA|nr:hypothetical protein EVAR_4418_1 [Eumeta japonica]
MFPSVNLFKSYERQAGRQEGSGKLQADSGFFGQAERERQRDREVGGQRGTDTELSVRKSDSHLAGFSSLGASWESSLA